MAETFNFPKTLGACADLFYKLKQEKSDAQKVVDEIEEKQKALKEHFINNVAKSNAQGVTGKLANVKVIVKTIPTVKAEDWEKVHKYIAKKGAFHLLQRRLNNKAVEELWEHGQEIPGVGRYDFKDISVTKA